MTHDSIKAVYTGEEPLGGDASLDLLVRLLEEEIAALRAALAEATDRQWTPSAVPKPRVDTTERSKGGGPADPTADTALDGRRLGVREAVLAATPVVREAAIAVMGSRIALERATDRFDGEQ